MQSDKTDDIRLAAVTGRHPYDVPGFHRLLGSLEGIDWYLQHIEDFGASPRDVRAAYDVVMFYHFYRDTPCDQGQWEQGMKSAFEDLGTSRQGIFELHHAILAFPEWPLWTALCGITDTTRARSRTRTTVPSFGAAFSGVRAGSAPV